MFRSSTFLLAPLLVFTACPPSTSASDAGVDAGPPVALTGSRQGAALALVDFDGDGLADKLVGAPFATSGGHTGAVLVYRGLPGGAFAFRPIVLTGGDNFGAALLATGDLDGDGQGDFAVGAPHASTGVGLTGAVTLFRGGRSGEVLATLAAGGSSAKFGFALAAGDFDADGRVDVAVGAPFDSPAPELYQAGQVFVFFGPDFTRSHPMTPTGAVKGLGWALTAGDLSGDGTSDLVLGATGRVVAFFGRAGFSPAVTAPDLTVSSAAAQFGRSLLVLGDWSGDGIGELVIGAPTAAAGTTRDVGAFFVVKGAAASRAVDLGALPAPADLLGVVKGSAAFDRLGAQLARAGDLDGDGRPELLVSAPMADVTTNDLAGRLFLFKSASALELTAATGFSGAQRSGWFGAALATTPDGKVFVGAPRSEAETGAVTLIDLATGEQVKSGSSGGATGSAGCHCDETGECHC
ncbi:MAG: integrin alpha [Myxococcota bacterium]